MVEFALAMPLMIFLFVMVVEVARLLSAYSLITEIANDSARFWSRQENQSMTVPQITTLVKESLEGNHTDMNVVSVTAFEQPDPVIGTFTQMVVQISFTIQPVAPLEIASYKILDPGFTVVAEGIYAKEAPF
jgi:Flp pilus assembly protein TadG